MRLTTGAMPAGKLAGYFSSYAFQALQHKLPERADAVHPLLVHRLSRAGAGGRGRWPGASGASPDTLFPAGLDRDLLRRRGGSLLRRLGALPAADGGPGGLLASRLRRQMAGAGLRGRNWRSAWASPTVNYQHWDGYRDVRRRAARRLPTGTACGWITTGACATTWKRDGALPARKGQQLRPGDIVVTSELGHNVEFTAPLSHLADSAIRRRDSAAPDRPELAFGILDRGGRLPAVRRLDRPDRPRRARMVMERHPTLEYLTIDSPEAAEQIVSGIFPNDRWMSQAGIVVLKSPAASQKGRAPSSTFRRTPRRGR